MALGLGERTGGCLRCQEIEDEEAKGKESNETPMKPSINDTNSAQEAACKSNRFYHQFELSQTR